MGSSLAEEFDKLANLTVGQLRRRYAEVFKEQTRAGNKPWLVKRIAWRLQALAEGDLSERARRRAEELANDSDLRLSPPKANVPKKQAVTAADSNHVPAPGTILVRRYKGQTLQVRVLKDAFEFDGKMYKSLSAIAKTITGSHCSGHLFFRIRGASQ